MKIFKIRKGLYDIFLDYNTFPTGFEESCWLRLQLSYGKPPITWKQLAGIKLPSYKFQEITKTLETFLRLHSLLGT